MFRFSGSIASSKSWMNRALILQSWNPEIKINGQSSADDVQMLQTALQQINQTTEFEAGHGGTTFRFLALRLSRMSGRFFVKASHALLNRPQQELLDFLIQVGVSGELTDQGLKIISEGWKKPNQPIKVSTENSSQFISAVLLSSFNLNFPIDLVLSEKMTSVSYLNMTLDLIKQTGVRFEIKNQSVHIAALLKPQSVNLISELDISSAFSLICAGVLDGDVTINNWSVTNTQPDAVFLKIFDQMKIAYEINGSVFKIKRQHEYVGTDFNIGQAPDLFPALCIVAAYAKTHSQFFGAPQLIHKESNRIQKTAELLKRSGLGHEVLSDGMVLKPLLNTILPGEFTFDPENDHRMAMAAGLLKLKQVAIHISTPDVVNKSYPEFFQQVGISP